MGVRFTTAFTRLVGVEHPIQCGTMQWLSRARLVAAAAEAGVLACLPASSFETPGALADEIKKTRDLTDRPFGVNVTLLPSLRPISHDEMIDTVIEAGVRIIETAGRSPEPYMEKIRGAGLMHLHKCARVRDAVKANRLGCKAVSIVGAECGGHPGMDMVATMVLLPMTVEAVSVPVLAGGGFCDGATLAAALVMGASGAVMGTRFIATEECEAHRLVKERILAATERDTVITMASLRNPARVLRNQCADRVLDMEAAGADLDELAPLIDGRSARRAWSSGEMDEGLLHCGQVVGRVNEILPIKELVRRIVSEARDAALRLDGLLS